MGNNTYSSSFPRLSDGYSLCIGMNTPTYAVLDVTADGRPDLVVTQRCNDSATGNTRWLVYPGTAAGFTEPPTDFALPTGYSKPNGDLFPYTTGKLGACNGDYVPAYTLLDMTADGRPDLVVTRRCNDNATSSSRWLVYPSGPAGFADTPTDFALPPGYAKPNVPVFSTIAGELGSCGSANVPSYTVMDLTADGRPDLVVTRRCGDDATASSRWLVYPSGPAGFAATPTDFALPPGYAYGNNPPFAEISNHYISCLSSENVPSYALLDMTADGRLDMVLMGRCKEQLTGNSRWLVHPMCSP